MRRASARLGSCAFILILTVLLSGAPASAFEFFDGRVQVHGFYEAQIRSIAENFEPGKGWDLTQWYNVLNLEIEADIAPDGVGPFDLISGFLRFDIRYDCVWRNACGMSRSADMYGNRAGKLADRVSGRRRGGLYGHVENQDTRRYAGVPRDRLGINNVPFWSVEDPPPQFNYRREASRVFDVPGIEGFFGIAGVDGVLGTADDPANVAFGNLAGCKYGFQRLKGSNNGSGGRTLPWNFRTDCRIRETALNSDQPNPFRGQYDFFAGLGRANPLVAQPNSLSSNAGAGSPFVGGDLNTVAFQAPSFPDGNVGFGDLPLRPAPKNAFTDNANRAEARGIWLPSAPNAKLIREGKFDNADQNFRQRQLEWNRGGSQQETKELREAYLDMEFLDSRLWVRAGKQQIVWGKTELFRTTDQFNPQDLALASLPSLEESRIGLFAVRAVWSFYDLGPFEDVRLELAANYDQFEPADLGRCGEPYSPLVVCDKTFGLQAHGLAGLAIAGEIRPEDPWDDLSGLEFGGRLEWRWDRFSFALTNFWGYNDTPYTDQINRYSRNVDPFTGRPRQGMAGGGCDTDPFNAGVSRQDPAFINSAVDPDCLTANNALTNHSINQTTFHLICASSIGFTGLDRTVCGQSVFSSKAAAFGAGTNPVTTPTIGALLSNLLVGNPSAGSVGAALAGAAFPGTIVPLNVDPCDGFLADCLTTATGTFTNIIDGVPGSIPDIDTPNAFYNGGPGAGVTMNAVLTQQQKALAGCGQFYGTNCEIDGVDLMNSEVSALMQSWVGIEGTGIDGVGLTGNTFQNVAQPGTVGFVPFRGPVATRTVGSQVMVLPGARGANESPTVNFADDPGYNPGVDGCAGTTTGSAAGCNAGDVVMRPDGSFTAPRATAASFLQHPFAGSGPDRTIGTLDDIPGQYQYFASEMSALSFNAMMTTVALSLPDLDGVIEASEFDQTRPFRTDGCSFETPILCSAMAAFWAITGVQRADVRAAGNGRYGRRDFVWAGGGEVVLKYQKRNVLGLSMDVAEDFTKTNWSFEFTWINDLPFTDNNQLDGISTADTLNLTVSVDRPTFINFLNANRTFFFNSQWFFQYVSGYEQGFTSNGPWNMLATLTGFTGYFQDRLLPTATVVYDFNSNSGAFLPSVTYRFTEAFSATFGVAGFWGRQQRVRTPITPLSLPDRAGANAYNSFAENGLSVVKERDELFLRIKYTF